jgi:hypothetical protein
MIEQKPQTYARAAGVLYLAIIVLGLFGELYVRATLVVPGNAAATAQAIANAPLLWRAGIVGDLLMHLCDVLVIVVFYLLLRPVSKSLALLATLINLVQTAVLAANKLNLVVPLLLLQDGVYAKAFAPEQLHALSQLAIHAHAYGYLTFKCGFWPKTLGVLIAIAGLSYLINSFALLLAPAVAAALFPAVLIPALIGELVLCLWLIFKGVDMQAWQQRVDASQHIAR